MKVLGPKLWTNIAPEMKSLPFRKTFSRLLKLNLLDSLPKYTGHYKPKFKRKNELYTSILEMFDADDSNDSTFLGFEPSPNTSAIT